MRMQMKYMRSCFACAIASAFALIGSAVADIDADAPGTAHTRTPQDVKDALLRLVSQWHGASGASTNPTVAEHLGWTADTDPCYQRWQGIKCACFTPDDVLASDLPCQPPSTPRVTELDLSGPLADPLPLLYGPLPDVFAALTHLTLLDLSNHRLWDLMPNSIYTHPALISASFAGNLLSGPIAPDNMTKITSTLDVVDVRYNMLFGTVPASLCTLSSLLLDGNSLLCGELAPCLRGGPIDSALATGISSVGANYHNCSAELPQCVSPPPSLMASLSHVFALPPSLAGKLCKLTLNFGTVSTRSLTIDLSKLERVDALVLHITDRALVHYNAWFWLTADMLQISNLPKVRCLRAHCKAQMGLLSCLRLSTNLSCDAFRCCASDAELAA